MKHTPQKTAAHLMETLGEEGAPCHEACGLRFCHTTSESHEHRFMMERISQKLHTSCRRCVKKVRPVMKRLTGITPSRSVLLATSSVRGWASGMCGAMSLSLMPGRSSTCVRRGWDQLTRIFRLYTDLLRYELTQGLVAECARCHSRRSERQPMQAAVIQPCRMGQTGGRLCSL